MNKYLEVFKRFDDRITKLEESQTMILQIINRWLKEERNK